jgi:hypothetical protein
MPPQRNSVELYNLENLWFVRGVTAATAATAATLQAYQVEVPLLFYCTHLEPHHDGVRCNEKGVSGERSGIAYRGTRKTAQDAKSRDLANVRYRCLFVG